VDKSMFGRAGAVGALVAGLSAVGVALLPTLGMRAATAPRMVNLSGKKIPSIYDGEVPRKRYAQAIQNASTHHAPPPCSQRKDAVYHPDADPPQFQQVQDCSGEYFEELYRSCPPDDCGGGEESYVTSTSKNCGVGYTWDSYACRSGCREEITCPTECD